VKSFPYRIADFVRLKIRGSPHVRFYRSPDSARALAIKGAVCGTACYGLLSADRSVHIYAGDECPLIVMHERAPVRPPTVQMARRSPRSVLYGQRDSWRALPHGSRRKQVRGRQDTESPGY
jgi:hypothetical protein